MNLEDVLEDKEPPSGGLLRLRQSIEQEPARHWKPKNLLWGLVATSLVTSLLLLFFSRPSPSPAPELFSTADQISLGLVAVSTTLPRDRQHQTQFLKLNEDTQMTYYRVLKAH